MARKRLTLPDADRLAARPEPAPETKAMFPMGVARHGRPETASAPIAQVAGEAASSAALAGLAEEVASARAAGRLALPLPLDAVDEAYLVRDRIGADAEELASLMQSIRARGQQVPIEVAALGEGRYGLITGWRRLTALRRLRAEMPGDIRFATILAVLRRPESAAEAYLAMIEENEIRVGLSYYERARIVARAAEQGVFPNAAAALAHLFASASRAKRSKIGSFLRIHAALDDRLRFAAAIPERLGLSVVKALDTDPGFADRVRERLRKTPPADPAAELAALDAALKRPAAAETRRPAPAREEAEPGYAETLTPGIRLTAAPGRLLLEGPGVTALLQARLTAWIRDGRS